MGGQVHHSAATLRVSGDDLVPETIFRLLGAAPTGYQIKGQQIGKTRPRIAKFGLWRFSATRQQPADLDAQIHEIFSRMTDDLNVWKKLRAEYQVDLFCGLFTETWNEGIELSPESLATLGLRGILLDLDIYTTRPENDEEEEA